MVEHSQPQERTDQRPNSLTTLFWRELAAVILLIVLANLIGLFLQPLTTVNGGRGVDGVHYYNMAQEIAQDQPVTDNAPFVYRLATPFLAAHLLPGDLILGFTLVNLVAGVVAAILLWLWLRLHVESPLVRLLVSALFIFHWLAPLRYNYFNPVLVDSWFYPIALAGLIMVFLLERKPRLALVFGLTLLVFVGVFFREVALLLAVALLGSCLVRLFLARRSLTRLALPFNPAFLALPLLAGIAAIAITHLLPATTGQYSFVSASIRWLTTKNPLRYVFDWAIAFGPVLILPLFAFRPILAWLRENIGAALFFLLVIGISYIGGANTMRFAYWAMPVVYVLAGVTLQATPRFWTKPLFIALGVLQLIELAHTPGDTAF